MKRGYEAVCVNAHDRCYLGGDCPYCEIRKKQSKKELKDG
jgi:hypothetical protein